MSFNWETPKKVEQYDPGAKRTYITEATPKYIVQNPYGFRQEDIVHSLAIVASELIEMAEAQARSLRNIQLMKESVNATKAETQEVQTKRDSDDKDPAEHSRAAEEDGQDRGRLAESSGVEHSSP